MKMRWSKLGLIYRPDGTLPWAQSYAFMPTARVLGDVVRVFFASLDENKFGRVGFVDLDRRNLRNVLRTAVEPLIDLGEAGTFDDSGVSPSCVVDVNGRTFLYYVGWQRCEKVPYMLYTGLATSVDGLTFKRASRTPVLDRTSNEPFLRSGPTIVATDGVLKMWYNSAVRWTKVNGAAYPMYIIRYAESVNGFDWKAREERCIDFKDESEFGFGRPWVVRDHDAYRMWYSIRSRTSPYRIGYAESFDGLKWIRKDDQAGIEASSTGWDSEMICYPCVVDIDGQRYMFYNGNRHGSTGFGHAVLES